MKKNVCSHVDYLVYRNGFTLIELLAVIVILAIIALIATPIILNIIDSSKRQAVLRSGELYLDGVKDEIARKNLTSEFSPEKCEIQSDGNLLCDGEKLTVETSGEKPSKGSITLEKGKITEVKDMVLGDYTLETDEAGNLRIKEGNTIEDEPYEDPSGANAPEIKDGLTPVKWNGSAWEVTTEDDPDWYDYSKQEWANAVILNDGVNKSKGQTVKVPTSTSEETEVKAMLVWIPRYSYTISDTAGSNPSLPGAIDIKFIGTNLIEDGEATYSGEEPSGWHTHPAFWWDNNSDGEREEGEELSGFWVGKFETTGTKDDPTILPNLKSLTNQTVSEEFSTSRLFETKYGISFDSHMAKNSEWGAVAYLSQSKYGKYGNPNYTETNKEVYMNNSGYEFDGDYYVAYVGYTGRSSGNTSLPYFSDEGTCTYDNKTPGSESEGTALCGEGASTTGNITGVYDMSGGANEYVMGYLEGVNGDQPWGSASITDLAQFSVQPTSKYYDAYESLDSSSNDASLSATACNGGICYGHALSETRGWYDDFASLVYSHSPWFERGGDFRPSDGIDGVFCFYSSDGRKDTRNGFRLVLVSA